MSVTPPYQLIDTLSRMREQSGAAWGNAAQNVGRSVGAGIQSGIESSDAEKMAAQKSADAQQHSILQPIFSNNDILHSNDPAAKGLPTMHDAVSAAGGRTTPGMQTLALRPKQQEKADSAKTLEDTKIAAEKEKAAAKVKADADAAKEKEGAKFDATHMEVDDKLGKLLGLPKGTYPTDFVKAQVGAEQRKGTGKDAADAKRDVADINAAAKKAIAEISFRMKSPDHQIQLQAMKDRDAYIIKHPTSSALFGTPADIGKTPAKGASAEKPAAGGLDDLDALMVKHGVP